MISRARLAAAFNAYLAFWEALTQKFRTDKWSLTKYEQEVVYTAFNYRANVMLSSRRIYEDGGLPLAALLRATCAGGIGLKGLGHLECTDPRDKIFALLSIASDREELRRQNVFPDYTKSCVEIYMSTTAALLQQGHWSHLSLCQTPKLRLELPSWAPDWSRPATDMLQDVGGDFITMIPEFCASGATSGGSSIAVMREDRSDIRLTVVASIYDEIHAIGSFPKRGSSLEVPASEGFSWPQQWLLEIVRLTYQISSHYADFSDRLVAASRTSVGGATWSESGKMERVYDQHFADAVILLRKGKRNITDSQFKGDVKQFLSRKSVRKILLDKDNQHQLGSEINARCPRRLPFITQKGHLGLSAEYVERGDVITLIRGCQVPFVLRSRADRMYQLISEAYIDGIMDGEAARTSIFGPLELV